MLKTRKEAIDFLRQKYGNRIKFSQAMDREIPELQTGNGLATTHIFIVIIDNQMLQCHVCANGEISTFPDYQREHQCLVNDWE